MDFITAEVCSVLAVAGWSQRLLKKKGFLDVFQEKLTVIGTLALRLQTTIGETITSGDMGTLKVSSSTNFDPDTMEDSSQDGRSTKAGKGERVAGTTEIGLQRLMKGSNIQILRKPKVVLCSELD